MFGFFDKKKTFRPTKVKYKNDKFSQLKTDFHTLGSPNMRELVKLPPGTNLDEWLASSTIDFFNELNLIYGTVQDGCTEQSCPHMSAGEGYEYLWQDSAKYPTPTDVPASKYVELLFDYAESCINDDSIFNMNNEFPKDFKKRVSTIFRRFFRVYAHIYHCHLNEISEFAADVHLNSCFQHFYLFCEEFNLIPAEELAPLAPVIASLKQK